jgi:uncharacterized membrane protein
MGIDRLAPYRALRNLLRAATRLVLNRRGNIGVLTAVLVVPIGGALAVGTEGASWYLIKRAA